MIKKGAVCFALLFIYLGSFSQTENNIASANIQPPQIEQRPKIDGILEPEIWSALPVATDFWLQAPIDGEKAKKQTEVRISYDEKNLYIAATCYDSPDYVIQTLKRDQQGDSDEFSVVIDPNLEQTNGYFFSVNARGAQTEALTSPTSIGLNSQAYDTGWDNKWRAAVSNHADRWIVEIEIPFKTLRSKSGLASWGINFIRNEPDQNEVHVWSPVPRQFDASDLGYLGQMRWSEIPKYKGSNMAFIPYLRVANTKNYRPEQDPTTDLEVGADAKIAITPTLNLGIHQCSDKKVKHLNISPYLPK